MQGDGYLIDKHDTLVELESELVSLPEVKESLKLLEILPPELAEFYRHETNVISGLPLLVEVEFPWSKGGGDAEYAKFVCRLLASDMVALGENEPKQVNPTFFVRKPNGKQRFIINAKPANSRHVRPARAGCG